MQQQRRWKLGAIIAICLAVAIASLADEVRGQPPYPTTVAPPQAWGGHAIAQQVPFQPTFSGPLVAAGVQPPPIFTTSAPPPGTPYTLAAPVALPSEPPAAEGAGPAWQPYPGTGASAPPPPASFPIEAPIYAATPEWNLRASLIPPDARDGFFQKAKFTATWLPQLGDDNLGWTDLRSEVVTALPFFTRENPIIITPSYELHFLDRPAGFDLPPRLHDLVMDFHVFRVYDNQWIFDFAVTPGLYADDYSFDSSDACRINGRAVAVYAPSPTWKWILGATYLNGAWAKVVPIAGFVYEPNDDVKYEAVFPRPRVAWRLGSSPVPGRDEYWFYLLGEFANSIWAFQQDDGTPDVLAYRDFRFIAGLERKIVGGLTHRVEAGWVFNRDIKLASSGDRDIGFGDTAILRVGVAY